MSERTLHRRLAEQGQTFQSIANHAQREAAESLLANGDSSLAEVAFLTGFSDQSAFTRAFKGWTGQTPLMFRESVSGKADTFRTWQLFGYPEPMYPKAYRWMVGP